MHRTTCMALITALFFASNPANAAWHAEEIILPGKLRAINAEQTAPRLHTDAGWYRIAPDSLALSPIQPPPQLVLSPPPLPESAVATSDGIVARAWLVEPTESYQHGVFGHHYEASALMIEHQDGSVVRALPGPDAVFEDLRPRIVTLGGAPRIVLVRSTIKGGSGLVVIDPVSAQVIAATPVIGHPRAWINPVGVADFQGVGSEQIAVVRQPHVVGALELWMWRDGQLVKSGSTEDTTNHFFGSLALGMSAVSDFDGDMHPDIAIPSLDRRFVRLIGFAPAMHEIARVPLPARASTDIAVIANGILVGLEDGRLFAIRQ